MMHRKILRVHRKNSAFLYAILESLDGMASFSTLADAPGQDHRDILVMIPEGFLSEMAIVIEGIRKRFSVLEIEPPGDSHASKT